MENSGKILFDDDVPQWYIAFGDEWVGPLTAADVYERILENEITWAHYVWRKGQVEWKRICDTKAFQSALPQQPPKGIQREVKNAIKPVVRQSSARGAHPGEPGSLRGGSAQRWYLHYNSSQFGPFAEEEVKRFLKTRKIQGPIFGWREGLKNWERLDQIDLFRQEFASGQPAPKRGRSPSQPTGHRAEQRANPRRPLVAKIIMTDEQSVIVGVCRDISIGGLQVLTNRIPANVGAKLKMNISPSTNELGRRIEPFVAEGVIVRILEDGRGFSFRFERLTERAQHAIESYIESPA